MEAKVNKKNIPQEYIVKLQGKMNKGVYSCFNYKCLYKHKHRASEFNVIEDIVGFAKSSIGMMVVWECKGCGEKYFFHLRENEGVSYHDYVIMYHNYKTKGSYIGHKKF